MAAFMMSPDGHMIPPLNVNQPAPSMNLKGFEWGTVSDDIHNSPGGVGHGSLPNQGSQPILVHQGPSSRAPGGTPAAPPAVSSPVAGPSTTPSAVPTQLATQLGIGQAQQKGVGPAFPLEHFQGAYAGNGFNTIFRPRQTNDNKFVDFTEQTVEALEGVNDNILELNLTLEQLSFGAPLGKIPNRGFGSQADVNLFGVPYLQTVQDVTNPDSGKGDNTKQTGIHFEPGVWLNVPAADFQNKQDSIVRMASIPHGTTINAQGFVPTRNLSPQSVMGGELKGPAFDTLDARPFNIGQPNSQDSLQGAFSSLDVNKKKSFRIPQDLKKLATSGKITSELIRNPNLYLKAAIKDLNITETITFEVHTGPGPPDQKLNGGGTTNVAFLAGKQDPVTTAFPGSDGSMNAHAVSMRAKYWIERVIYKVPVGPLKANEEMKIPVFAQMPKDSTAPTPKFLIKAPPGGIPNQTTIDVPGIQIQTSQLVLLNFGGLTWPHVSVSTLVPAESQLFTASEQKK